MLWWKANAFKAKDDPSPVQYEAGSVRIDAASVGFYTGPLKHIDEQLADIKSRLSSVRLEVKDDTAQLLSASRHTIMGGIQTATSEIVGVVEQCQRDTEGHAENRFRDLGARVGEVGGKVDELGKDVARMDGKRTR